jgi:hypothetical protein
MYRTLGCGLMLGTLLFLAPTEVHAQKKKKKNDAVPMATAQDYAQLIQLKDVTGKLVFAELSAQNVTLRLDYPHMEQNPNYRPNNAANSALHRDMQRVMNDQAGLARIANPVHRQQKMRQLAIDMQRLQTQLVRNGSNPNNLPYKVVTESKDFELPVDDKVVVRRQNLPYQYDDKGNVVQFSKEEIEKLRGKDKSKPGYEAKFEDLAQGMLVKLYLKAPPPKSTTTAAKDKDAKDPKDGELKEPEEIRKPRVTMILILQDSPEALNNQQDQKKKKKN